MKQMVISSESTSHPKQHTAPCADCPWARKSIKGWIGPNSIATWIRAVHSDQRINCHTRVDGAGEPWQCAGAAIHRANVCKSPRDPTVLQLKPNSKLVFSWGEFENHHRGSPLDVD